MGGICIYPLPGLPSGQALLLPRVCWLIPPPRLILSGVRSSQHARGCGIQQQLVLLSQRERRIKLVHGTYLKRVGMVSLRNSVFMFYQSAGG